MGPGKGSTGPQSLIPACRPGRGGMGPDPSIQGLIQMHRGSAGPDPTHRPVLCHSSSLWAQHLEHHWLRLAVFRASFCSTPTYPFGNSHCFMVPNGVQILCNVPKTGQLSIPLRVSMLLIHKCAKETPSRAQPRHCTGTSWQWPFTGTSSSTKKSGCMKQKLHIDP